MTLPGKHSFIDLQDKKTLIRGDIRTGKTTLTASLLEEAVELGLSGEITVVDMAPISEDIKGNIIGGRLSDATEACKRVRYLAPQKVETPRLRAGSAKELMSMIQLNVKSILPLLEEYMETPSSILFINDISIYFQSASDYPITRIVDISDTFIANGYYGEHLSEDLGTGVSEMEKELMERLSSKMDGVISLTTRIG